KPCMGLLHEEDIRDFPFFGFSDIDVIYGRIARFYSEAVLAETDVVSTHPERISGHFAVFRNTRAIRHAFERIPGYHQRLEEADNAALDEVPYRDAFVSSSATERTRFVEQYANVLGKRGWHDGTMNYPGRWFWQRGRLTNDRDGDREFLYLHFF